MSFRGGQDFRKIYSHFYTKLVNELSNANSVLQINLQYGFFYPAPRPGLAAMPEEWSREYFEHLRSPIADRRRPKAKPSCRERPLEGGRAPDPTGAASAVAPGAFIKSSCSRPLSQNSQKCRCLHGTSPGRCPKLTGTRHHARGPRSRLSLPRRLLESCL